MTPDSLTPARRPRLLGLAAFALILLVATAALPLLTMAMTVRGDDAVTIGAGETVADDLVVASDHFVLAGSAALDVIVAAREVEIDGQVGGSLNVTGGTVAIRGRVDGSVRVVGGSVDVTGSIGGDLLVIGGTATVASGGSVRGDVTMFGGSLTSKGEIRGDVTGSVERLSIDGPVAGDVRVRAGDLNIDAAGRIGGDLSYTSGSEADIAAGATISGTTDRRSIAPWGADDAARGRFLSPMVRTLWMLVAGAAIVLLAPRLASALDANLRRPLAALITGVIAAIAIPAIVLLLAMTVIGIPFSLILLGLTVTALYLSQYIVGQRIGTLILPERWNDGSRGYLLLAMTLGVLILSVLRFLPVPFIGSAVDAIVALAGLGAAALLLGQLRPDGRPSRFVAR